MLRVMQKKKKNLVGGPYMLDTRIPMWLGLGRPKGDDTYEVRTVDMPAGDMGVYIPAKEGS
jgi:hypothetical protein